MARASFPSLTRFDHYAVDFETTGLKHRDKPVGMSLSLPDGTDHYLAWGHKGGNNNCSVEEVAAWAKAECNTGKKVCILFNGVFDKRMGHSVGIELTDRIEDPGIMCALLNEHEPGFELDELAEKYLGVRKLDEELNQWCAKAFGGKPTRRAQAANYWKAPAHIVAPYAKQDARMTRVLWDLKRLEIDALNLANVFDLETQLIPVLHSMYWEGVRINVDRAKKTKAQFAVWEQEQRARWLELVGEPTNYNSGLQLAKVFDRFGYAYNRNAPTPNMLEHGKTLGNPCFDKFELEAMAEGGNPLAGIITRSRKFNHYKGTFIQNYLLDNVGDDGFIHPNFYQVKTPWGGTITGRFSSAGGLNAQNIPARDEQLAAIIRGLFIPASKDHQWLKLDYSQIEYRFFAHYAGGNIMRAYQADPRIDFHQMVADLTGLPRKHAKNINFAKLYGAGLAKLALSIGCTLEEAQEFIDTYEAKIPASKRLYNRCMNRGSARGYVITWGGRVNRFRSVGVARKKYIGTHAALNKLLQGSAADLIKVAMVKVGGYIDWQSTKLHLTVHDELDLSVPKGAAGKRIARDIKEIMEDVDLRVPVIAEASLGPDWGHTVELAA